MVADPRRTVKADSAAGLGGHCHSADEPWHVAPILSGRA